MAPDPLRGPDDAGAASPDEGAGPPSGRVVVTASDTALGRAVTSRLADLDVVGIGDRPTQGAGGTDVLTDDLGPLVAGAGVVVHLGSVFGASLEEDDEVERADDVTGAQRLLDAAGEAGVGHVVLLSSATVYGAWANNPLPLTEDATLRPAPDLAFAVQRAEIERRLAEWRAAHGAATATVLRPAPVVGGDERSDWLARALHAARRVADIEGDPPSQFLHLDDLAGAVEVSVRRRLDGARNVAPDGWLRGAEYTALDAGTPKVRVPAAVGDRVSRLRWRLRLAPTPPGLVAYARHPWVVANDRLRSDGWVPEHSNEEAFVAGTPATALATLSPRRRQEIALGVSGGALAAVVGGVAVWAVRRSRR